MNKKLKIYKIKNEYGVDPRELCDIKEAREMIERVSIYHNLKGKDHMIDSITWNDLEMDEVFHLVNHTRSYAGEQVLYHILHGSETEKRDRIDKEADYFAQNEDERINMELGLMNIGKGYLNYYIPDVIDGFGKILVRNTYIYPLLLIALILSLIGTIFHSSFILFLLVFAIINLFVYLIFKLRFENELTSLGSIREFILFCDNLKKSDKLSELYLTDEDKKKLSRLCKMTKVLELYRQRSMMQNSGNPLGGLLEYLLGITLIDPICCIGVIKRIQAYKDDILDFYELTGWIDMVISVASFRECMDSCKPEIKESGYIECEQIYHPMLKSPVKNDLDMKRNCFFTGANATGKSTFMKALAINVILGETIYTCTADRMTFPDMYVMTSMALRDDVLMGESYYVREIKYLKRMLEVADSGKKTMIVIDEILKGTNTKERIAASRAVLDYLADRNAVVIAATHDMELVEFMDDKYDAYYFDCDIEDGEVKFNYVLHQGKNKVTNAIMLMKGMEFPDVIIGHAIEYSEESVA
ncbi:MAG: hypothetical protein IKS48_00730 [Eubacterium sp.]|nr:hypothetical protein [Eubacterium sp.]